MTYIRSVQLASQVKASLIHCGTPTAAAAGGRFSLSGDTSDTGVTLSANRVTLYPDASYYLEASPLFAQGNISGTINFRFYNVTSSQYVGSDATYEFKPAGTSAPLRVQRLCAHAFIPSSDISSAVEVEVRIISLTGTGWDMTVTATGCFGYDICGYPTMRILKIPD